MRKMMTFTMVIIMFSMLNAQQKKPEVAPINPEYIKYLKMLKRKDIKKYSSQGHALGYIPHPMEFNKEVPVELKKITSLPDKYDLKDQGSLTPVKNQLNCGSCWAFATMGSIESRWLDLGFGPYNLSEQNLKNGHGFYWGHCSGGNEVMATAYFSRGNGPVSEADDPYNIADSTYVSGLIIQGYIPDARFLPNNKDILKQTIYDHGAVYTDMYWEDSAYDTLDHTYCYSGSDTVSNNHAVLLVGWDDNMVCNGGTGVWIIRNSWGPNWGDSGFFYISYNDVKVHTNPAFWPNRMNYNPNATVHYYDTLGYVGSYGWAYNDTINHVLFDSTDYGLVKFTVYQNQQITKVGTWINSSNSTVSFNIYDNFNGYVLSNLLGSVSNQTCLYAGYYTFDLPSPITLNNGDDIFIKVKYNTPSTEYCIPIEMYSYKYANPIIETGKCWVSENGNNYTWLTIGIGTGNNFDLCIKAYGESESSQVDNTFNTLLPKEITLYQNYPNPFNPSTTIRFSLLRNEHVTLKVFDTRGREIHKLIDKRMDAGDHTVRFDGSGLASGIYYYSLHAGSHHKTMKMVLVK